MISDTSSILPIIDELINEHPNEVQAFKNGKTKLLGFFVGQLMKRTKGKADPKLANKLLMEKLNSYSLKKLFYRIDPFICII